MNTLTVVGYSNAHFNPSCQSVPYALSSAGALAEAIYLAARQASSDVVYVDANSPWTWPELDGVTHLVSIESGFMALLKKYRPHNSLLFAVNQEARSSIGRWLDPIGKGDLPLASILGSHDLHSRDPRPAQYADSVLAVGDNRTFGTYAAVRGPHSTHVVSYGEGGIQLDRRKPHMRKVLLLPASSIGVRKGLDFAELLCEEVERRGAHDLQVAVMGNVSNSFWQTEMNKLVLRFPSTFRYLGWIAPQSNEHRELLQDTLCAITPSREEGLVGAAVESLRSGIPVFSTVDCGLGARPSAFVLTGDAQDGWASRVVDFALEIRRGSSTDSQKNLVHSAYESTDQVADAIRRFCLGEPISPHLSICQRDAQTTVRRHGLESDKSMSSWLDKAWRGDRAGLELDSALTAAAFLASNPSFDSVEISTYPELGGCHPQFLVGSVFGNRIVEYEVAGVEVGHVQLNARWKPAKASGPKAQMSPRYRRAAIGLLSAYALHGAWRYKSIRKSIASRVRGLMGHA